MASPSGWRLLTSSLKVRGSPTLLIKHETLTSNDGKVSGLKVCLTDLTYLWMEILERKELIRKACNTSIDPVEQFNTLIDYLDRGLSFLQGTNLFLTCVKGRSHLVLQLRTPLPKPLKPLEWNFDLKHAPEIDFTRELIIPLLANLYETQNALSDLQNIIKHKDSAIERIDNELKTHDKQITGLFDKRFYGDNVSERNKQGILMNKIPGMRRFDNDKWQQERAEQVLPSLKDLQKHLFEKSLTSKPTASSIVQEAWWENLGSGVDVEEPSQISQPLLLHRQSTSAFESTQLRGNETQHEYTHREGLRSSSPIQPESASNRNDQNADSDSTASTTSDLETPAPTPSRRIGRIGGGQKPPPEQSGRESSPTPNNRSTDTHSVDAAVATKSNPHRGGAGRGGIGKIGGSRTAEQAATGRLSQTEQMPNRSMNRGGGGEDSQTPAVAAAAAAATAGPSRSKATAETAEEIANRNRAALKRDLEEKRKAPVKKKRKF